MAHNTKLRTAESADVEEAQLEPTKLGVWPCMERSVYSNGGGIMGGKVLGITEIGIRP